MISPTTSNWKRIVISSMVLVLLSFTSACAADKKEAVSSFPYQAAQKLINQQSGGECTFFGYYEGDHGRVNVYYKTPKGEGRDPKPFILLTTEKGQRWFTFSPINPGDLQALE